MNRDYPEQAFRQALLNPELPAPEGLCSWNGSDPARRFDVYRNNVIVSLIEALADSCPVTQEMVGEPFFRAMAREYVLTNPPDSPVLAHYGASFPDFIAAFEPADSLPFLADLARLELLRVDAFHAADAEPIAIDRLGQVLADPERLPRLKLGLHPALRLLNSDSAVLSLWAAHQGSLALASVDPAQPEQILILRPQWEVELLRIDPASSQFVETLRQGAPLGLALEQALSVSDHFDPGTVLQLLIAKGAIVALR